MKSFSLRTCLVVILLLAVSLAPAQSTRKSISPNSDFRRQVDYQLLRTQNTLRERGYQRSHLFQYDQLGDNDSTEFPLHLRGDKEYVIAGACDQNCSDIDILLYDENQNLIVINSKPNDRPFVRLSPRQNAQFSVRVNMDSCGAAPCYLGIGVFGK